MTSDLDDSVARLRSFWDSMAVDQKTDSDKLGFNPRPQRMRFEAFIIHHDLVGKSILDVGCGLGYLWAHLSACGIDCDYHGVDLSAEMIQQCRARFPKSNFEVRNILDWEPTRKFDYVVAFGIHNVKLDGAAELFDRVTRRQFELCENAAHTAVLTDRYAGLGPQAKAWKAEEGLCMALGITPYVVLRHDYLPNDFSLTLYRRPLIDTRADLRLA